jgi:hypothetical protein
MNTRVGKAKCIKPSVAVLLLGLALVFAAAGDLFAMRCGNDLVLTGDREFEVIKKCGEPDFVSIDGWAYNFGSNLLIHYLHFDNGRLTRIELGEYGWDEADARARYGSRWYGPPMWLYPPHVPPGLRP